jgi:hypothetical protein
LPFIPQRHSIFPELKILTLLKATKLNQALPKRERYLGLASSTAEDQYVDKYRTFFSWANRRYGIADPFAQEITIPFIENQPKIRLPLGVAKLNKLFQTAALRTNPAEVWIPVLAFFTGGRLGELVYLQKRDVKQSDSRWISPPAGRAQRRQHCLCLTATILPQPLITI